MKKSTLITSIYLLLLSHFSLVLAGSSGGSTGTATVVGCSVATPFNWTAVVILVFSVVPSLVALAKGLLKFLRWLRWRMKHGKPETPVVIFNN